jgi:hypothetical protein
VSSARRRRGGGELGHLRDGARVHARVDPTLDRRGRQGHQARSSDGRSNPKLIADNGIWLSTQAFPDNIVDVYPPGSLERLKAQAILVGLDRTFTLARKYRIKVAFGTDILFSAEQAKDQGALLVMTTRWYSPAEALAMATGLGAQLLALSGERNPSPGKVDATQHRPAAVRAPFTNAPRTLMLAVTNLPCRPGKDTALGAPR